MPVELTVPSAGESITEVQVGRWLKNEGDAVELDEPVVEIDTDKVSMEVPAPSRGVIVKILKKQGDAATVGETIAVIDENGAPGKATAPAKAAAAPAPAKAASAASGDGARVMPAAARAMAEKGLSAGDVKGSGPGGRVLKEDVDRAGAAGAQRAAPAAKGSTPASRADAIPTAVVSKAPAGPRHEEAVRMTPLRKQIAKRLVEAQQTAAMLTTFNEIDMSAVMATRKKYKEAFQERYGVSLGFMSFFVKAAVDALKFVPAVNAMIRGEEIIYRNYCDICVAVGGGKGLVTPVLRNSELMSFADVEKSIGDFAKRARDNKLTLDELQGGTFTITNGGIYGSLMSTPILNPPQSGILGMHAIQERPIARDGQVVVRPMMYVALSYDHRIIDGREAVTFLKRIKECIEEPDRMLMEI